MKTSNPDYPLPMPFLALQRQLNFLKLTFQRVSFKVLIWGGRTKKGLFLMQNHGVQMIPVNQQVFTLYPSTLSWLISMLFLAGYYLKSLPAKHRVSQHEGTAKQKLIIGFMSSTSQQNPCGSCGEAIYRELHPLSILSLTVGGCVPGGKPSKAVNISLSFSINFSSHRILSILVSPHVGTKG